jgi:glutamate 5-kinase
VKRPIVVKIGSSSVTTSGGEVDTAVMGRLCREIAGLRAGGETVVVVSSGAIATGWAALGRDGPPIGEPAQLQALSALGQPKLMHSWGQALGVQGLAAGQVLLTPTDLMHRQQYLHARGTLSHLVALGVVPVVNENDAVADEEIRFGDNDRLAALVAHLVDARLLVLLTDAAGLLTADPRRAEAGSLIEEVVEIDHQLEALAGGPGSAVGSGGMASKLAAAKIATWSGVRTVIADAGRVGVLAGAVAGTRGVGTVFRPRPRSRRLPARKLWIAFARGASGTLVVDAGARRALEQAGRSLLPAGVVRAKGTFRSGDAVEIEGPEGRVFAKGLVRYGSRDAPRWLGRRRHDLPDELPDEVVHRDDLVLLD